MRLMGLGGILLTTLIPLFPGPAVFQDEVPNPLDCQIPPYVPPRGYVCYRTNGPLIIDGRLNKPVWEAVPWTEPFVDIMGDAKPKPRLRTRAKMLWDDDYFYVGAELEEPHVWATHTRHDSVIFEDNDFEIFIDPDGDSHEYCEFEINALNTSWDLLLTRPYKDGGKAVNSWEIPGLKTAVHVAGTLNDPRDKDQGWSVEVALPWKVLKELARRPAPPRDGDQWRVDFSRVEWLVNIKDGKYEKVPDRKEDNWVWSPQGVVNMHRPETWGYVQFSTAPVGTATFRPDRAGPVRYLLHRIYYAQRAYRLTHNRWAKTLGELALPELTCEGLARPAVLQVTQTGFEATAEIRLPGGIAQCWHIRQDAKIWRE